MPKEPTREELAKAMRELLDALKQQAVMEMSEQHGDKISEHHRSDTVRRLMRAKEAAQRLMGDL